MNRKGEMGNVETILLVFIAIVAGLALFTAIAQETGKSVDIAYANNVSYTVPAVGSTTDLAGQELISSITIVNTTSGAAIPANYTVAEGISSTSGLKRIIFTTTGTGYVGQAVKATYTYGPEGYVENSAARAIVSLIVIFAALGIAVVVMYPTIKSGLVDFG